MRRPTELLLATGNPGKRAELEELLRPAGVRVLGPEEVGWDGEVVEDGKTLEDNALKKAKAAVRAGERVALADDTGLFVDALGGEPGVQSARFAGPEQDPVANCAKLLGALEGVPRSERGAEFRCVIALATPEGEEHLFRGTCRGWITFKGRGDAGFGYDPIFELPETGRTFAEMPATEKHRWSHRGRALEALRAFLANLAEEGSS
jgi:XTP/dITP diphosphohydrolase